MTVFDDYLCNPVVGAVPRNLAGDVVAFEDVESSDQGNASMWGWGCHHMMSFRNTHAQITNDELYSEIEWQSHTE